MKTHTRDALIDFIRANQHVRVHDLVGHLGISAVAIHRHLKKLVSVGVLTKAGKPPTVFYAIAQQDHAGAAATQSLLLPADLLRAITDEFLFITPQGNLLFGIDGFTAWAQQYQPKGDILALAREYATLIEQKRADHPHGWMDATQKMNETFHQSFVDQLLFADVYSYPLFGRTKLAKLVMHAKQSEQSMLVDIIVRTIRPGLEHIIATFNIDAVAYIPPTIPRPVQFMDQLEKTLSLPLPHLSIAKVIPGDVPIAQKSLSTLKERVINAQSSIYPRQTTNPEHRRILLIDDVAGSGASFQETARKLKTLDTHIEKIIAFAIVGSIKGYDVIRQL